MSLDIGLSEREQQAIGVLRQADETWLPLWLLAKRMGCGWSKASHAVAGLRRRGLVVKRPSVRGLSKVEVSLARSGL